MATAKPVANTAWHWLIKLMTRFGIYCSLWIMIWGGANLASNQDFFEGNISPPLIGSLLLAWLISQLPKEIIWILTPIKRFLSMALLITTCTGLSVAAIDLSRIGRNQSFWSTEPSYLRLMLIISGGLMLGLIVILSLWRIKTKDKSD